MSTTTPRASAPRAPASRYAAAVALALVLAGGLGLLAAQFRPEAPWLTAGVFAACTSGPAYALGWVLLVRDRVVQRTAHEEEDVEGQWLQRAAAGALWDVLVVLGLSASVLAITGLELLAADALAVVAAVLMADVAVRYAVIARREG